GGGEEAAIGAIADAAHLSGVPAQGEAFGAAAGVPNLDHPVPHGAGDAGAVGAVADAAFPLQGEQVGAGAGVPDLDLTFSGAGDAAAVGAVADAPDCAGVPAQGERGALNPASQVAILPTAQIHTGAVEHLGCQANTASLPRAIGPGDLAVV